MKKIDTTEWKEFKISDIFENLIRGNCPIFRFLEDGETPVVSSSTYNQGIKGYYAVQASYINKITISLNGDSGFCSYHPYSFSANSDCGILFPKNNISDNVAWFLCTIITKTCQKYNFGEKATKDKLFSENIKLPITSSGEPNYKYMDSYMQFIKNTAEKKLQSLSTIL